MNMTPQQKIKWVVIDLNGDPDQQIDYPLPRVDEMYDELVEQDLHWDALAQIREGTVETNIECPSSRHYESKSVGTQLPDASWIGWTYWYGGGKHGRPEEIDWVSEAYDLNCATTTEVVVTKQTFTKARTV